MNIVLVYDKLNTGGTERLFVMIANLLHAHGHQVKAVLIRDEGTLDKDINQEVPVVYLRRRNKLSLLAMKKLADECRTADIVHVHAYYNWRYYFVSTSFFNAGKPRVVLQEHSDMQSVNFFDKIILQNLDGFIAVHPIQRSIAESAGVKKKNIFLLPNIVQASVKKKLSLPTHRIMMVGNIRREKNYELAIDILQHLPGNIGLDIFGNINDQEYYSLLCQLAREKNLDHRINFIQGETGIQGRISDYDLAIHTANNETGPLVVLEYLSMNLPFFSSSAGQSPVLIAAYLPGIIISSYNPVVWADKIIHYYKMDKKERESFQSQMEETAGKLLNPEQYYESLLSIYNQSFSG